MMTVERVILFRRNPLTCFVIQGSNEVILCESSRFPYRQCKPQLFSLTLP
jgi:hypothetical protein